MSSSTGMATRKRSLEEVVSPSFVAREDEGGAYDIREMPKRFVLECVADKGRFIDDKILALEADDARFTAWSNRVLSRLDAIIRRLRTENAARAAAAATPPPPSA
jgi:hypothetical protein